LIAAVGIHHEQQGAGAAVVSKDDLRAVWRPGWVEVWKAYVGVL
jgi:hypothetical protein